MLSEKAVEEYRQIYKERFGTDLALEEARERAERFMRLFQVVYRPIPPGNIYEGGSDYDED